MLAIKAKSISCAAENSIAALDTFCEFSLPVQVTWLGVPLSQKNAVVGLMAGKVVFASVELAAVKANEQTAANLVTDEYLRKLAAKWHMQVRVINHVVMLSGFDLDKQPMAGEPLEKALASDAMWAAMNDEGRVVLALGSMAMMDDISKMAQARY